MGGPGSRAVTKHSNLAPAWMRVHTLPPDFLPAGFVGIHLKPNFVELGNQSPGYADQDTRRLRD